MQNGLQELLVRADNGKRSENGSKRFKGKSKFNYNTVLCSKQLYRYFRSFRCSNIPYILNLILVSGDKCLADENGSRFTKTAYRNNRTKHQNKSVS